MRLSLKPCPRESLNRKAKSCIFRSSHARISSNLIGLVALPAHLSGLPPPHRRPPRLLPLLVLGRGRNFEGSSPPSQPQVGGILLWHWHAWQSFSIDEWTVAVLWDGYKVAFHYLPTVLLEPRELLSCSPGSDGALALRQEVSKMLQKEAVELVDQSGPGFYSWLFLVEKATGGWQPVIDLSALNGFVMLTKFKIETAASVLGSVRKGDWMFSIDLKYSYFQIPVHPESRPYLWFCLKGRVYQFCALCFGLSTTPQVFTRVFALVSEWAHRRGVRLLRYLNDWLVIAESRTFLLQHRDLVLQLCKDLGIVVDWEKSDLQPSTHVLYRDADRYVSRRGVPVASSSGSLSGCGDFFSLASIAPSTNVAAGIGPHGFAGAFSSSRSLADASFAVAPQGSLVPHNGRPYRSDPSVAGVHRGSSLVVPGGQVSVQCPSPGSSSVPVTANRRVPVGLGSPPVRYDGFGSVVPGREFTAHQCAGNDGCFSSSGDVSSPVVRSECRPDERQCHGCHLYPASGRDSISCSVLHGRRGSSLD